MSAVEWLEEMTDNCIDWVVEQFDRLHHYAILWMWIVVGGTMMITLIVMMIMRGYL